VDPQHARHLFDGLQPAPNRPRVPVLERPPSPTGKVPLLFGDASRSAHARSHPKAGRALKERSARQYVSAFAFLSVSLGLRDKDQAFYWLDKMVEERNPYLRALKILMATSSRREAAGDLAASRSSSGELRSETSAYR